MTSTDPQVRKLMEEHSRTGRVEVSGLRAGMDRKTARKYLKLEKLPSELRKERTYRTRADPFDLDWPAIKAQIAAAPDLEAKTILEDLQDRKPGQYHPGQLRTLQRKIKSWRAEEGPEKVIFFAQLHRPGEAAQTDFTNADELQITIAGVLFPHLLCHFVLPYSNWQCATICKSESMAAIKRGVQTAVFRLGRVPGFHQTDHSSAATHKLSKADRAKEMKGPDKSKSVRGFNKEYLGIMDHLGMIPRTIAVGEKEQNGDIESANGVLKRRLNQLLILRESRDFSDIAEYQSFIDKATSKANAARSKRVAEELENMSVLQVDRLVEFVELDVRVTSRSTIRVKRNTYSVHSRLIGEQVRVRIYEDRLEVRYNGKLQLTCERVLGEGGSLINYRHIIWSLVRKPGAFERYRYREALFPTAVFRRTYDSLCASLDLRKATVEYLRILKLAADTMETSVELALSETLAKSGVPLADSIREQVAPNEAKVPELEEPKVNLTEFDELLGAFSADLEEAL